MFTGHKVKSVRNSLVRHFCLRSETMSFLHLLLRIMCDNLVRGYSLVGTLFNRLSQVALNRIRWVSTQAVPPKLDNSLESQRDESALQARVNICALDVSVLPLIRGQQSQQHLS